MSLPRREPSSPGSTPLYVDDLVTNDHLDTESLILRPFSANASEDGGSDGSRCATPPSSQQRRWSAPSPSSPSWRIPLVAVGGVVSLLVAFGGGMAHQSRTVGGAGGYAAGSAETAAAAVVGVHQESPVIEEPSDVNATARGPAEGAAAAAAPAPTPAAAAGVDRSKFFKKLHIKQCRMSYMYDNDKTRYSLRHGTYLKEWEPAQRRAHFQHQKEVASHDHRHDGIVERAERRKKHGVRVHDVPPSERKLTFLHVGKAGGSSAVCSIRHSAYLIHKHCEGYGYDKGQTYHFPYHHANESAISRAVNCYVHYDYRLHCYDVNDSFLINVRHPLDRMLSWYVYEHPSNMPVTMPAETDGCEQLMLFSCYPTLDELVTVGLAGPRPDLGRSLLRVGTDLTARECAHWAWAAVTGTVGAEFHNVLNYGWYADYLLHARTEADVYALRVEHLDRDWRAIDVLLGGTGNWSPAEVGNEHMNSAASKDLKVENKTASEEGLRNLCRALCEEVQVYKAILHRAVNLEKEDVRESLEELRAKCPAEADLALGEECPR